MIVGSWPSGAPRTRTLAGVLRQRGEAPGAAEPALRLLVDGSWISWSWSDYWQAAQAACAALAHAGIKPADRVLMLTPDVEPAVRLLLGLWTRGAVPIQVGVPYRLGDVMAFVAELRALARRLDARALIVSGQLAAFASASSPDGQDVAILAAEELLLAGTASECRDDPEQAQAPALIQLTSGSTGHPRGVVIPHDRLVLHMESMSQALPEQRVGVTWLPLHHDMGLIGGLLFPLYNGFVDHVISPLDFRKRPLVWLQTLSERRATISPAPPSAYAMALRLARQAVEAQLDLSDWSCAMVGAEPISPQLLRQFAETFAPCGFRQNAFFPVYGLAEATVAVTFPQLLGGLAFDRVSRQALEQQRRAVPAEPDATDAVELTGCGRAIPNSEVKILAPDGSHCAEREVGEIWFRSASAMAGYFRDEQATVAALSEDWICTGDLGYQAGEQLYITGRKKELIIKAGHNLIPWMIEQASGEVSGIRTGCVVAVGVYDERIATERAFVVAETKAPPEEHDGLTTKLRSALSSRGMAVDRVILVAAGSLPKTTSGKLKRSAVAERLARGEAPV